MRLTPLARLYGGLFFFAWLVGISGWAGFFVSAHHVWPLGRLIRLVVAGGLNAGSLAVLRTPAPQMPRTRVAVPFTVGTTTTTGLALAGSCVGGLCTLPVAGLWGLPWLNALLIGDAALAPWIIRTLTALAVLMAWRHWRRLRQSPLAPPG